MLVLKLTHVSKSGLSCETNLSKLFAVICDFIWSLADLIPKSVCSRPTDNNPCVVLIPLFLRLPLRTSTRHGKTTVENKKKTLAKQNKAGEEHKRITSDLNKLLENHLYFISVYTARIFSRNIAIINLCAWAHGHITLYISIKITPCMTSQVVP